MFSRMYSSKIKAVVYCPKFTDPNLVVGGTSFIHRATARCRFQNQTLIEY